MNNENCQIGSGLGPIAFADLSPLYREVGAAVEAAAIRVLRSGWYVLGAEVEAFEEAFARAIGSKHCVGVDSGTSALRLALQAAGIGPGDEVITTPFTFIATVEAIHQIGAVPVLADIDPVTWNLDPEKTEKAITPKTRAILPVHIHGRPANLDAFEDICKRRDLILVEDGAQAHLARSHNRLCGTVGLAGCFSFYPGKNLGSAGEGGAVVTDDPVIAQRVRQLRNFGSERKYEHTLPGGTNARLESIQAAILAVKLPHLESWTQQREALATRYLSALKDLPLDLPAPAGQDRHVWHIFAIGTDQRDHLRQELAKRNIETGIHYPSPVHLFPACAYLGYDPGDFPIAERLAARTLSLPFWVGMSEGDLDRVVGGVKEILGSRGSVGSVGSG
jgi:dTDP-4-amino-4,6-dideoxygalactose transaminase